MYTYTFSRVKHMGNGLERLTISSDCALDNSILQSIYMDGWNLVWELGE